MFFLCYVVSPSSLFVHHGVQCFHNSLLDQICVDGIRASKNSVLSKVKLLLYKSHLVIMNMLCCNSGVVLAHISRS